MVSLHEFWPPAGVTVRTPRLELRWPTEGDLTALADLASRGVHPEAAMPFMTPWTRGSPTDVARSVLRWNWRSHGEWEPTKWCWPAVVVVDGVVVGTQGLDATDYGLCRTVETGSWLGRAHQGQGLGKEMRAAMLHLAFAGLDAERAETSAYDDNPSSLGVTRSLGYRENGDRVGAVEGRRRHELLFVLDRQTWLTRRRDDIELSGIGEARPLFGLDATPAVVEVEGAASSG